MGAFEHFSCGVLAGKVFDPSLRGRGRQRSNGSLNIFRRRFRTIELKVEKQDSAPAATFSGLFPQSG